LIYLTGPAFSIGGNSFEKAEAVRGEYSFGIHRNCSTWNAWENTGEKQRFFRGGLEKQTPKMALNEFLLEKRGVIAERRRRRQEGV
jgi:hypothetical protein